MAHWRSRRRLRFRGGCVLLCGVGRWWRVILCWRGRRTKKEEKSRLGESGHVEEFRHGVTGNAVKDLKMSELGNAPSSGLSATFSPSQWRRDSAIPLKDAAINPSRRWLTGNIVGQLLLIGVLVSRFREGHLRQLNTMRILSQRQFLLALCSFPTTSSFCLRFRFCSDRVSCIQPRPVILLFQARRIPLRDAGTRRS